MKKKKEKNLKHLDFAFSDDKFVRTQIQFQLILQKCIDIMQGYLIMVGMNIKIQT